MSTEKDSPNRFLDLKFPVSWFLSAAGGLIWAAISLYFTVQKLDETVVQMSATVRSLDESNRRIQNQLTLVEFRIGNMEYQLKEGKVTLRDYQTNPN